MTDKEREAYRRLHNEACDFLIKHWNDKDFGVKEEQINSNDPLSYYKEGSIMHDYILLQRKRPKSGLWQELLALEVGHLETKMKYERSKGNVS